MPNPLRRLATVLLVAAALAVSGTAVAQAAPTGTPYGDVAGR
ncbi:hypothetical protein [Kineococcus sp. SYSU DK001]